MPDDAAQNYWETVRERYEEFRDAAGPNQIAVMRYYTPAGEEIRVGTLQLHTATGTLLVQGDIAIPDTQGPGIPCDIIVHPYSCQLVLKLLTLAEPPPEKPTIGFIRD